MGLPPFGELPLEYTNIPRLMPWNFSSSAKRCLRLSRNLNSASCIICCLVTPLELLFQLAELSSTSSTLGTATLVELARKISISAAEDQSDESSINAAMGPRTSKLRLNMGLFFMVQPPGLSSGAIALEIPEFESFNNI